ncbi:MAG: hypothetical protein KF705_03955 [Phycisphaeraceae bacterium]|nr:hypothetical protein [Phycisphaeraceae bacterium]
MKDSLNISIVGASGYTGGELVERLLGHPHTRIVSLLGSEAAPGAKAEPRSFDALFPRLRGRVGMPILALDSRELCDAEVDVVFLATPHETSIALAPRLVDAGKRVIDLSGAWRLGSAARTKATYGLSSDRPEWFESAVYALVEINREKLRDASLASNPGCYPTASILANPLVLRSDRHAADHRRDERRFRRGAHPQREDDVRRGESPAVRRVESSPCSEIELHAGTGVVFTPHLAIRPRDPRDHPR